MRPRGSSLTCLLAILTLVACLDSPGPHLGRARDRSPAAALDPAAVSTLQERVRRWEYDVTWQDRTCLPGLPAAYHAPNRAQDLRTYFTPDGFRMTRRTATELRWEWGLSLITCGSAGTAAAPAAAQPVIADNRIEYRRGDLTEWYVNDERGLEQGFTLAAPPAGGADPAAPLVLELAISGDLKPSLIGAGEAIELASADGVPVLRYGQLAALDARGRRLPARMELADASARLRLAVDTRGATFPVTIDPLTTSAAWSFEGDQADAQLGHLVATAGDVNGDGFSDVILGSWVYDSGQVDEGKVFVFFGSPTGLGSAPGWTAEGNLDDAGFGFSVATAGDVNDDGYCEILVGAPYYSGLADQAGAAFLWYGYHPGLGAPGTMQNAVWKVYSTVPGEQLGYSVAGTGDVNGDGYGDVVLGAPRADGPYTDSGRLDVYWGSAEGLGSTPKQITIAATSGFIGSCVAAAGDVNGDGYADVLAGSPLYPIYGPGLGGGIALVFYGPGLSAELGKLWFARGTHAGAEFGASVSSAGDVNGDGYADVIVGEPLLNDGQVNEGGAHVFLGGATGLAPTAAWTSESDQADARMGTSVGTAGDADGNGFADVVVGVPRWDFGQNDEGMVCVWFGGLGGLGPATPAASADWKYESNVAGMALGTAVACAGDVDGDGLSDLLVGGPFYDHPETNEGLVMLFSGRKQGMVEGPQWSYEPDQADGALGWSVAAADVNGNGYTDLIIGAPYFDAGVTEEGAVFVFHGGASGPSLTTPAWTARGTQVAAAFGYSVANAGDVNGDGYDDVLVGASHYSDGGETGEGHAFLWLGSASGLGDPGTPANADWSAQANQSLANFGQCVAGVGDVNGDGYGDVLIAAPFFDSGQTNEGVVFLWRGSAAGLGDPGVPLNADWRAQSDQDDAQLGCSCAGAGDVDGDGLDDVIVGAFLYDGVIADEGAAFVWLAAASGLIISGTPANVDWSATGGQASCHFGFSVAGAGDVDGDAIGDVLVGAPYYDTTVEYGGRVYLYLGTHDGPAATPAVTKEGTQTGMELGGRVGGAGDVNGDGLADVFAAAPMYDSEWGSNAGAVFVWLGPTATIASHAGQGMAWGEPGSRFGSAAACAGDVNGDGFADVVVGAPLYSGGQTGEGEAYLWYGGGTRLNRVPRLFQQSATDYGPIAQHGQARSANSYLVSMFAYSPFGRGNVKIEWEQKDWTEPFDGTGLWHSRDWVGIPMPAGSTVITGTSDALPGHRLHWRARVRYDPVTTPWQAAGPWIGIPWSGRAGGGLRMAPPVVDVEPQRPVVTAGISLAAEPNPFRAGTALRFSLARSGAVNLAIYDARGQQVRTLLAGRALDAGPHSLPWDGTDDRGRAQPAGVYFARLATPQKEVSTRLVRVY